MSVYLKTQQYWNIAAGVPLFPIPYLQQIGPALEELGTRFSNLVLRIICNTFFDLQHLAVEQRQWSLHGQLLDLVSADIGLAPLPDNRYTRGKCGFKILQYAAAGLPSVASPVGVNAEHVQHGVTGFHAASHADWVEKLTQLIEDTPLRTRMGQAAQEGMGGFDHKRIAEQLGTILKKHMPQRQAHIDSIYETPDIE